MRAASSLEHVCGLITRPIRPDLGDGPPTAAAVLGAALVLLEQGVVAARRIDRDALGHVVRGRSARLDPDQVLTVASVQLASARCAAVVLNDLEVPHWQAQLQKRAAELKPDDPLTAMLFFSVGLGEVLVELGSDQDRAAKTLLTVLTAGAASAAATADLSLALNRARPSSSPPSRAQRRRSR